MADRYYEINNMVRFNRKEMENFLIHYVAKHNLTAGEIPSLGTGVTIERSIKHHPFRVARQIFGNDKVVTYTK